MQDGYSNMGSALMQKFYFCALNFPPTFFMIIKSVTRQVFFSNQSFEFFFFFFKFCQFSCTKQQHTYQVHRLFSLKCILQLSNHYAVSSLSWNSTTRKILKVLVIIFLFYFRCFYCSDKYKVASILYQHANMHTNLLSCVFFIIFGLQPQYNLDFLCIARFIIFAVLF